MSTFTPHTDREVAEMLAALKLSNLDELYQTIPSEFRLKDLDLPCGLSQMEVEKELKHLAAKNKVYPIILRGAGAYQHYIPAALKLLANRSEFVTAYTPYQAELSQGILQSIFEYQTMICELTGMDVSNASHYDGATAAAEAILMCKEKNRSKVVVAPFIKQDTLKVLKTYLTSMEIIIAPHNEDGQVDTDKMTSLIDNSVAAIYLEQPNSVGIIEDAKKLGDIAHSQGVKFVMNCYPIALGLIKKPSECGADVAVGEGQSLGLEMAFGGPYIGIMATTKAMQRKLPGRIVGETTDAKGNKAYVLTLQAREQHIRREKAGSNICSNQAHCALKLAMYLALMGENGLRNVANACVSNAHYLADELTKIGLKRKYNGEFFNEFITTSSYDTKLILSQLESQGILGGLPINNTDILWCATETVNKEDIDKVIRIIKEAVC